MNDCIAKKSGLIFSSDFKTVLGLDPDSNEFSGNIPNGVESCEEEAFSCCDLTEVNLPDSVLSVGTNLFCNSIKLEKVKLSANLKQLSPYMFCGCTSLEKIEMPLEVEDFTEGLFAGCSSLKEIPFRAGIKTLPEGVFDSCSQVNSLIIPDSVTSIKSGAISNMENLKTIVFPANLCDFEIGAIQDCPSVTRIRISDENTVFRCDELGQILYKKDSSGNETIVYEIPNKTISEVPEILDNPDENPSIISYENDEEIDEDTIPLSSELQKGVEKMSENENNDVDARLAEIMGQGKMFSEGDFTIMDIPEASEEEMEASCLAPTEQNEDFERTFEIPKMQVPQSSENQNNEKSMEERLSEIMAQDKENEGFSIMDIPAATDEEIENDCIVSEGDFAEGVESADSAIPEVPQAEITSRNEGSYEDDEKAVMHNLFFEAKKVEQVTLDHEADEQRILYVFAEELSNGQFGKIFSKRLVKCANRIAEIQKFTSIFFFSGIDLENEKFRGQFTRYMKTKDVVIACKAGNLGSLSSNALQFAECTSVPLSKEKILEQVNAVREPGCFCVKLILQDNLAE